MTPTELRSCLSRLVAGRLTLAVMIWGPPGVGKSSIVAQSAARQGLELVDLRLGQLAPTDLRGYPVAEGGVTRWCPPDFLPRSGEGVLFLDDINLAPPALQGIAQQLVFDRRVGNYAVPPGWFIWAAGDRKQDDPTAFEMPSPLARRMLHLDVSPDLASFRAYAIERGLHEKLVAFLAYRPELLHRLDARAAAWPSPRTWEMASRLHERGLSVDAAVGAAAASELRAFLWDCEQLEAIEAILAGGGQIQPFPDPTSMRHGLVVALASRARTADQLLAGFRWLTGRSSPEWLTLWGSTLLAQLRARGELHVLADATWRDEGLREFLREYHLRLVLGLGE